VTGDRRARLSMAETSDFGWAAWPLPSVGASLPGCSGKLPAIMAQSATGFATEKHQAACSSTWQP
jgi:hypothetical protein